MSADLIKLQINAGQAVATPPIGPVLGQKGVNAVDFCKEFNELTSIYHSTFQMNVKVYVVKRKFKLEVFYPSTVFFLKKAAKLKKSSGNYANMPVLSIRWVFELAIIKKLEPRYSNHETLAMCKIILGTARSLKLELAE